MVFSYRLGTNCWDLALLQCLLHTVKQMGPVMCSFPVYVVLFLLECYCVGLPYFSGKGSPASIVLGIFTQHVPKILWDQMFPKDLWIL